MMPKMRSGSACSSAGVQQAELDAEEAEEQADGREREGDRIAEQQEHHQRREHQRRDIGDEEGWVMLEPPSARLAIERGMLGRSSDPG